MKIYFLALLLSPVLFFAQQAADLPQTWLLRWQAPTNQDRPLKIVHGLDPKRANQDGMRYYLQRGLGGVVFNVDFTQYMRSEEKKRIFLNGYHAGRAAGINFWIYDEDGYPSGAAGGLVLQENPQFEAMELAFDAGQQDTLLVRPAFEHTHAANNFYAVRRYINIMDDRAVQSFIRHTHEKYRTWIQPFPGDHIKAFFTDEPSLIAVDLGQIPDQARATVPVRDSVNRSIPELPSVPWVYDMVEQYQKKYGQNLHSSRRSLFAGANAQDRLVRRQFWSLVADLVSTRYFGALQRWCQQNGVASSGHLLREESLIHHVPLYGNALQAMAAFDIPGLDMLDSDPEEVFHNGWLAAALPYSAATLQGRRRVMTEVSDFEQTLHGLDPVSLDDMCAAAAWQAAWGVTDFTLYYDVDKREADTVKAYGDFVGRLNAVLAESRRKDVVLLYYPISDLMQEYIPVGKKLELDSQTPRAQRIIHSFVRMGRNLARHQINFILIDDNGLAAARVTKDGLLTIGQSSFAGLLIPEDAELAPKVQALVNKERMAGTVVLSDRKGSLSENDNLADLLKPGFVLKPSCSTMVMSHFSRDGREILLLSNAGKKNWQGEIGGTEKYKWLQMNPASGEIKSIQQQGSLALALSARETILLVAE